MRLIYQTLLILTISVLVTSCGVAEVGVGETNEAPDIGSALVQTPPEDRRVAIVHSQASKENFYDPFAYNQLFASVQQQSMMAGIPFDLLDEAALATTANLLDYDAILIPYITHVTESNRSAIKTRLLEAQENGVGILTSGEFMTLKPDGTGYVDANSAMTEVLGVQPIEWLNGVSATITVADNTHPISKTYQTGEVLTSYAQMWFANFTPSDGQQPTPLTLIQAGGVDYNGAQIIERTGPVVHFSNEQVLADNNQLWRVIQWMVYGDVAPLSLQVSRSDHVFLARNDMDQAMIAAQLTQTEIPLLYLIEEWKQEYNFVGSYYIDIGNDPSIGQYTDWGVSAPLYQEYINLGNEIATHSWTHPHETSLLTAAELEFEFKDSAAEIGTQVGVPVVGAAVPGMAESLFVVETLNPWLEYLSGRTGSVGSGYPGAFGFLEPQHDMMYFSLNMSPDFTLIDFQGNTAKQAQAIWKTELDGVLKHAQVPLVHWLWHDYGPTTQTVAGLYSKEMFSETIAYAESLGAEFTTLKNMQDRIRSFASVDFTVGSAGVITATVSAADVGQFALKISEDSKISSVSNWYAYDEDQVFLPDTGGQFEISVGPTAADVTRISKLPMRARLLDVTGDGNTLSFSMHGEGEVSVSLSTAMIQNASVSGADSYTENNGVLTIRFNKAATHSVEITKLNQNSASQNYASTGIADQSTIAYGGKPGRAIDGNQSGVWTQGSVTHTRNENQPWWEVTLAEPIEVSQVVLYNRTDACCVSRLNDVHVFVSEQAFGSQTLAQLLARSDISHTFLAGVQSNEIVNVAVSGMGKYVRVQLAGKGTLSLAEVEVFGVERNFASTGVASQSTTRHSGLAGRAIDGNTSGVWQEGSVTHTSTENQPWWEVALAERVEVDRVVLYNRSDCCTSRLNGVHVFVSEQAFGTQTLAQLLARSDISHTYLAGVQGDEIDVAVASVGKYVRVQLAGNGVLSLAEVEVFGTEASEPTEPTEPTVAPISSLLDNGGFESGLDSWLSCSDSGTTQVVAGGTEGVNAVQIKDTDCLYQEFAVTPNASYTMSCQGKGDLTQYTSITFAIQDTNYADLVAEEVVAINKQYQLYELTATAPANGTIGVLALYSEDTGSFDDCRVVQQ